MKILVVGLNYAPEKVGIAVYTSGLAEALAADGNQVQVIAGQPYYPEWRVSPGYPKYRYTRRDENGVDVTRVPHYVPLKPTGLKRLLHHLTFAVSSFFTIFKRALTFKPDVILTIAPSLASAPAATFAGKISRAKTWLHIQDFEVDAAFATGLLREDSIFGRLAQSFEAKLLRGFDVISTISPQMCAKLLEKGTSQTKIYQFRNWADLNGTQPIPDKNKFRAAWNIQTPNVALYSGNIANKQGIDILIDAARILENRQDLTFVICGDGPNRKNLEASAAALGNVKFRELQPKNDLSNLMALATIHLLPQMAGAADLVLPSKLTNMLASGRPVVATAAAGTGLFDEVDGCGINTPPGDATAFAAAIIKLIEDRDLHEVFSKAARARAEARWSKINILSEFNSRLDVLLRD